MTGKPRDTAAQAASLNPALEQLDILVGHWDVTISHVSALPDPEFTAHQRTSFEWIEDGKFVLQRSEAPAPNFPHSTAIIGPDNLAGRYCMLYFDSRGVSRIYEMSLDQGVWKLWRNFPGFSQRLSGTISPDSTTIHASWEKSTDGATWDHDFDLTYSRLKQASA